MAACYNYSQWSLDKKATPICSVKWIYQISSFLEDISIYYIRDTGKIKLYKNNTLIHIYGVIDLGKIIWNDDEWKQGLKSQQQIFKLCSENKFLHSWLYSFIKLNKL